MLGPLAGSLWDAGGTGAGAGDEVATWGPGRGGSRVGFWAGMGPWNISSVACMHCSTVRPRGFSRLGLAPGATAGLEAGGLGRGMLTRRYLDGEPVPLDAVRLDEVDEGLHVCPALLYYLGEDEALSRSRVRLGIGGGRGPWEGGRGRTFSSSVNGDAISADGEPFPCRAVESLVESGP